MSGEFISRIRSALILMVLGLMTFAIKDIALEVNDVKVQGLPRSLLVAGFLSASLVELAQAAALLSSATLDDWLARTRVALVNQDQVLKTAPDGAERNRLQRKRDRQYRCEQALKFVRSDLATWAKIAVLTLAVATFVAVFSAVTIGGPVLGATITKDSSPPEGNLAQPKP